MTTQSSVNATDRPSAEPTKPGRSEHNRQLLATAHRRLDTLVEDAEQGNLFGTVAIEAGLEHGRITTVRRRIDGTDK